MNYQIMPKPDVTIQRTRRRGINAGYRFPSVSIFMPFNPKMGMKTSIMSSLSKATDTVVSELRDKYPGEMSLLVIQKLKAIFKILNFNTYKKSLAIFVSPVFEKIYYLNMNIEETVIVNESLRIRDLVYSRKTSQQFHILRLGEKESRIFSGDGNSSIKIIPEEFRLENTSGNNTAKQTKYLSGRGTSKGIPIEKYIQQVDQSLDNVLRTDRLPVFVIGAEKIVDQFKSLTIHHGAFAEYVYGDFEKHAVSDLREFLKPYMSNWQQIRQKGISNLIRKAAAENKLSMGLEDVQRDVSNCRGQLLFLENQYLGDGGDSWEGYAWNHQTNGTYNKFSNVKNPVDEMIDKVLRNGGDIELVSRGSLKDYNSIALIRN